MEPACVQHRSGVDLQIRHAHSLHPDRVHAMHSGRVAERFRVGGKISGDDRTHSHHGTVAHIAMLVNACPHSDIRPGTDSDVTGQEHAGGQRDTVFQLAVVRDIHLVHQECVVAQARLGMPPLMNLRVLTQDIRTADADPVSRTESIHVSRMLPRADLRRCSDHGAGAEPIAVSDDDRTDDHHARADRITRAQRDVADQLGGRMNRVHGAPTLLIRSRQPACRARRMPHLSR